LPETLPVVTLHQPWASLVLVGAKPFETRSWAPPARLIGKPLGIHAGLAVARRLPPEIAEAVADILGRDWADTVPTGRLLCTVTVRGAWKTGERSTDGTVATAGCRDGSPILTHFREDRFGDYTTGRWIWGLDRVAALTPPLPARGRQGLWSLPASSLITP
jgi:hypothetical protein